MAFKLVTTGDCCYEPGGKQDIISRQMKALRPDMGLLLGDVCQGQGGERVYREWFDDSYGKLFGSVNLQGIPGNHDRIASPHSDPFRKRFGVERPADTWWAANAGPKWMIVALDDNHRYVAEQTTWLKQVLKDNREGAQRYVVLAWHAPRFIQPPTSVKNNTRVDPWWKLIVSDPYTRLILNGHQHSFRQKAYRNNGYLRDVVIVGTGGGDKPNDRNRYGLGVIWLFDGGGYSIRYRARIDRGYKLSPTPQGIQKFFLRRPAQRVRVTSGEGSVPPPRPQEPVAVAPPPPPTPPSQPQPAPADPPREDPKSKFTYRDDVIFLS